MPAPSVPPPGMPPPNPPAAENPDGRVRPLQGLTFKQAWATLAVALALGLLLSGVELFIQWREMRAEVRTDLETTLALLQGSASEAAYQMHPGLARNLVQGLFAFDAVQRVELRDNFGGVLAVHERNPQPLPRVLATRLFGDVIHYRLPLSYSASSAPPQVVGELSVDLSAAVLAERFLEQARINGIIGVLRALGISILLVLIFNLMITRPLLRLSRAIERVDPTRPGHWRTPQLAGHDHDELGLLLRNFRGLLGAFQHGLDERDRAEQAISSLNRELEQRVTERTAELQRTLYDLKEKKAQADEAHRELAKSNHLVVESIRYARRIQTAMLPDKQALGDAVDDIHVFWEPLHVVGGDYFWLERLDGKSLLFMADCTGHGVPGAFITLVVASALDRILHEQGLRSPGAILTALDQAVRTRLHQDRVSPGCEELAESDDGLDAAVALVDGERGTVTFAGAGLPLLYLEGGEVKTIKGARVHLGYRSLPSPDSIPEHRFPLGPDTALYLFTDGIHDQLGGEPRRLLGRKRLVKLIEEMRDRPMQEQIARLRRELEVYRGEGPILDDMTLIGVRPRRLETL